MRPPRRAAFTLIECALTLVIIGVGTVGMLQFMAAGTMSNAESSELLTGLNLANHVREMSRGLKFADPTTPTTWGAEAAETTATYDDIDDLDGKSFSPPLDARRQSLSSSRIGRRRWSSRPSRRVTSRRRPRTRIIAYYLGVEALALAGMITACVLADMPTRTDWFRFAALAICATSHIQLSRRQEERRRSSGRNHRSTST